MIQPGMARRKRSEHYVNNKELLAALVSYRSEVERTFLVKYGREPTKQDRGTRWDTKPPIPRYIGECFLKIANHLSFKPNFVNYMFKEDMISDGIETVFSIYIILTQRNPRIPLRISLRLFITLFCVVFSERKDS